MTEMGTVPMGVLLLPKLLFQVEFMAEKYLSLSTCHILSTNFRGDYFSIVLYSRAKFLIFKVSFLLKMPVHINRSNSFWYDIVQDDRNDIGVTSRSLWVILVDLEQFAKLNDKLTDNCVYWDPAGSQNKVHSNFLFQVLIKIFLPAGH